MRKDEVMKLVTELENVAKASTMYKYVKDHLEQIEVLIDEYECADFREL